METLNNTLPSKKTSSTSKAIKFALLLAISTCLYSCGKTTERDVLDQQKEIERIDFQISNYINARKELATKYNKLLAYPQTPANSADIKKSLMQIHETIVEYDEKIAELSEERIEAIQDLNEYVSDLETWIAPTDPIDPNRWDFLLSTN